MKNNILIIFILLTNYSSIAQDIVHRKTIHWLELAPVSNYVMGRNIRLTYHLQSKKHAFYAGVATHINFTKQRFSVTNLVTRTNGYARNWYDHLHANIGYEKFWRFNTSFDFLFFTDVVGGKIKLLDYYYIPIGYDNNRNLIEYSLVNRNLNLLPATYMQLTFGFGCNVKLSDALVLNSRIGVGESITREYYLEDINTRVYSNTLDHFIGHYQIGIRYKFR